MEASAWERLSHLLDEALDLPPAARSSWLEGLAAADAPLKARLVELLSNATPAEHTDFLRTLPKLTIRESGEGDESAEGPGAIVGPYRLVRPLGEGGMGTVWLAERIDGIVPRPVALKLPRGAWPRRAMADRLVRERTILAALAHPNIARLYDAGLTNEGRPYLALEFVEGLPVDRYCREHRLDVRAILAVFLQVVRAVAYAHGKLIVHRDLKPSNILVTGDGQARLLDFGIAKLLDEDSPLQDGLTEIAGCPQTPEYASPEQVSGEPLSIASDVYSLGVVLYELLTGVRPYDLRRDSRRAMEQSILQADVKAPSNRVEDQQLRRALGGDLDTIVLKALKKPPDERYATVPAFGDDLHRWLDGRPVLARPDSRLYRIRKFVLRNRVATMAAAVTLSAIVIAGAVSIWQAREAQAQRNAAVQEKERADAEAELARRAARIAQANEELTDYLTADLSVKRSTTELEQQLERAIGMVNQRFGSDPLVRVNLLYGIAGRLRQLSSVDRHRALVNDLLGSTRTAGDENIRAQLTCWRARDLSQTGQAAEGRDLIDHVLRELRARAPVPKPTLLSCLADASAIARLAGDAPRAIATIDEVRQIEEASGLGRTDGYADTLFILARAYALAGRYGDGERTAARSVELRAAIGRADSTGTTNTRTFQATLLRDGGQPARALEILEGLIASHIGRGGSPQSVPSLEYEAGLTLVRLGRSGEALPRLRRAGASALERGDAAVTRASAVARILALADVGQLAAARALLKETESDFARPRAERQYAARSFLFAAAHLALAQGDREGAQAALGEARSILAPLPNPDDPAWRVLHSYAARLALLERRYEDARRSAGEALAFARKQAIDPAASLFVGEDLSARAEAALALGDAAGAGEDARSAIAHLVAVAARAHPALARAQAIAAGRR